MWIIGFVVGMLIGGLFDSMPATLFCGVACAIGVELYQRRSKSPRHEGERQPGTAALSPLGTGPVETTLLRRIDALTARVEALELAVAAGSGQVSEAAVPAAATAPVEPLDQRAATVAPVQTVAAEPSPEPIDMPERMPPAAAAADAALDPDGDIADAGVSDQAAPHAVRPPPRPPARPWRERLPAPLQRLIFGGNTLVKVGVLLVFLGLAFLLSYTAERVTVPVELRYALVALAGAGLLASGWFLRGRRRDYALVLQGAGIGVFYLTTLAAMKLSGLLPPALGFGFLFAVAVLSALLAVLQNAPVLAIVAALEGFAAPVLASTGGGRAAGLLSYLLVLDIGIALVAWFKAWRPLHLIGLVGTFTLAGSWAQQSYTADQYAVVQTFLVVFFLLFAVIGLSFARRTLADTPAGADDASLADRALATLRRVGRVDSSLVFGAPMAAFGLQYVLVRDTAFGPAFSALAFGAFYLSLGRFVAARWPQGLALLAEAYAIVGVIFATLAVPLAVEGQWTGAAWAVEAAGMYWLGIRQQRVYSRAFAFVLVVGAVLQLLGAIRPGPADGALLQGSLIGPVLLAAGVFAVWLLHRRHRLDLGTGWEAIAGAPLPWIGVGALTLLPWQTLSPPAAAAATALLSVVTFAVSLRFGLAPLRAIVHALQLLAVLAFVATLQFGGLTGRSVLDGGREGPLEAALIVLSVLGTVAASMRLAHRAALDHGTPPVWTGSQRVGPVAGVALLHLAMLLGLDVQQIAVVWPVTALVVFWVALRLAHAPLAALAAILHAAAAVGFGAMVFIQRLFDSPATDLPAFANFDFWTPLAAGLTALVAGDWLRAEAERHASAAGAAVVGRRWVNAWCARPPIRWLPVVVGLFWWTVAVVGESQRVLALSGHADLVPAATVGLLLATSIAARVIADRRRWRELRESTLATLPLLVLTAMAAAGDLLVAGSTEGYRPASGFGWLAWPLALLWHLRLLRLHDRFAAPARLAPWHVAGLWFFLCLATGECRHLFRGLGDGGSAWSFLGWVLVPTVLLWALRSPGVLRRWPLDGQRRAYIDIALTPVAVLLLGGCWVSNVTNAGDAAPLPYLPLVNPLELAHGLVVVACGLWWRALSPERGPRVSSTAAARIAAVTGWALLTGIVLRSCHHLLGVPWDVASLYASWPTQAAVSIAWAVCGVLAMVAGHARAARPVWVAGAGLIAVVVLKLFFVELADQGGLFRIVSFIGVGVLLLLVGYFAPVPPARRGLDEVAA